jgi:hypothetical protein
VSSAWLCYIYRTFLRTFTKHPSGTGFLRVWDHFSRRSLYVYIMINSRHVFLFTVNIETTEVCARSSFGVSSLVDSNTSQRTRKTSDRHRVARQVRLPSQPFTPKVNGSACAVAPARRNEDQKRASWFLSCSFCTRALALRPRTV